MPTELTLNRLNKQSKPNMKRLEENAQLRLNPLLNFTQTNSDIKLRHKQKNEEEHTIYVENLDFREKPRNKDFHYNRGQNTTIE